MQQKITQETPKRCFVSQDRRLLFSGPRSQHRRLIVSSYLPTVLKECQTNRSSLEYEIMNNFIPIEATRDRSAHHNVPVFRLARALGGARSHLVWMLR